MDGNNLRRAEAAERARLLTIDSYTVDLDLTKDDVEFDSTTVIRFACSEPGASTFVELIAASVKTIELNGRQLDPATVVDGNRIRLDGLAADQRADGGRPLRLLPQRRGPAPLRRPGRRRGLPLHASSRRPTPSGCTRASTSPTSRRSSRFTVTAPAALAGRVQRARRRARPGRRRRLDAGSSRPRRGCRTYITAIVRRPVPRGARRVERPRRHRSLGRLLPGVARRSTSTPTRSSRSPSRASTSSSEQFGRPLPVHEVRPAVRARSSTPARWRTPAASPSSRTTSSARKVTDAARDAAGQHDPARDGAHVVRRPRHHALVGRPVAQRVVRRVHGLPLAPRRRDPLHRRVDRRSRPAARPGATGRTSCPRPTRSSPTRPTSRRSRPTSTASPTPRARRCCKQLVAWVGLEHVPGRRCAPTSTSTPGATPRLADLLAELEAARRPRPARAGPRSGWRPPGQHAAPAFEVGRRRHLHLVRCRAGGARRLPDAALAPHRDRPLRPRRRRGLRPPRAGRDRRRPAR